MENRAHAIVAGTFALALLAGIVAAGVWLSRGGGAFRDPYVLVSKTSISGLEDHAPVLYRGVAIGRVEGTRFDAADPHVILIDVSLTPGMHVTTSTYARLGFRGVAGMAYVELNEDAHSGQHLITSSQNPARIEMRPSTLQEFGDAGQTLLVRVNDIAGRLNTLLNDKNVKQMSDTLTAIQRMSSRLATVQDKLAPTLDRLPAVADNAGEMLRHGDALLKEMNDLTRQASRRLESLDGVERSADAMGSAAEAFSSTTLPSLNRLVDRLGRATEELQRVLETQAEQPQSILFGASPPEPGPGEVGFGRQQRKKPHE